MERQSVLELLRMILIAFVIAFVINIFRVLIYTPWNNEPRFENITNPEPEPIQVQNNNYESQDRINNKNGINEPQINKYPVWEKTINIILTPLENLSGLSKSRILEKRMDAMRSSMLFSQMDYTPSSSVFQITDGLPWISANAALHWSKVSEREKYSTASRDSIGILNPELLYYVSFAENEDAITENFKPLYRDFYFIPDRLTYNTDTNTITAYIKNDKIKNGNYQPICLADSNAHDLGYKYAYMDKSNNIGFYSEEPYKNNNLKSGVKEITGYYVHGSACGVPGGCNNYAPYWQYYNYFYIYAFPATVHIKLWRRRPQNTNQEADINYEMIFE